MIWGEVVNSVRSIHLGLVHEFSVDPKLILKDIELKITGEFPFPEAIDDFDEWDELVPPAALEDILPLHPVERVLLEGPILPIQKIKFHSLKELEALFQIIFSLEKQWADQVKLLTPSIDKFLERACAAQALRLSTRLGFRKLGAV